ncbi:MAG: ROK family protein [Candidatus Saccharimonadales bacterium]
MYVGIDIGGTKTLVAVFAEDGTLGQTVKFPTNDNYQRFLSDLKVQAKSLDTKDFSAGASGVAGVINRDKGIVITCGNLSWHDEPIKQDLEAIFNCPFVIENDAKAGGLAEAEFISDEFKNVLFVTIGTGIGTTYIINGKIDLSLGDGGGRAMMIEYEDKIQPWEEFASGTAIVKKYGKRAADITDEATWKEIAHALSLGFLDLLGVVSPDAIVIGGGVGSHFDRFDSFLETELKQYENNILKIPPLLPARNPEQAVIYGCYQLIKQHEKAA